MTTVIVDLYYTDTSMDEVKLKISVTYNLFHMNIILLSLSPSPLLSVSILSLLHHLSLALQQTTAHKWHVHVDLPQEGVECVFAVGWHFNPFNVDLGPTYGAECGIDAPLR